MLQPPTTKEKIVLGIDPGTTIMGWGVVKIQGSQLSLVKLGVLKFKEEEDHFQKLNKIFETTLTLIDTYLPHEMAAESPFFGKNVQSMLKLGRAQGVALAAAMYRNLPVNEYSPKKIKQSITGNGNATKEQVALLLQQQLGFTELPKHLDATDGLAAAVCHYFQTKHAGEVKKVTAKAASNWKSFLSANPDRVLGK